MINSISNIESRSDKISHHGYHRFYDRFLHQFSEHDEILMLELGYEDGYSIDIWKKYFKKARIHSIDIIDNPENLLVDQFFKVDQNSNKELDQFVLENTEKYDFIIDDASHVPTHQWNTFIRFMSILKENGVYIIEDIETSYWGKSEIFGYEFDSAQTSILKKIPIIIDAINREFSQEVLVEKYNLTKDESFAVNQIESLTCGYNCIIFTKKTAGNSQYYRENSSYRHNGFINSKKIVAKLNKPNFFQRLFKI